MLLLKTSCGCCTLRTGTITWSAILLAFLTVYFVATLSAIAITGIEYSKESLPAIVYLAVIIIIRVLQISFQVILIYGAVKRKRTFLVPSLILEGILTVVTSINGVIESCAAEDYSTRMQSIFAGIAGVGLRCYIWLIVFSFYKELREEGKAEII